MYIRTPAFVSFETYPIFNNIQFLMDKVAESIEELDLQMYQIIFSKSKLDDIVEKLEKLDQSGLTVQLPVSTRIVHLEWSISNLGVTPYLDSVHDQLNHILSTLPSQD